jgi:hypothetical protein
MVGRAHLNPIKEHTMKTTSTRSLVLLAGLAVASQSAFAFPPPVTNVGLMPGDLAVGPAANAQHEQVIAAGTLNGQPIYLAVWSDLRSRQVGGASVQTDSDIYAIRLDANLAPIDPVPFVISGRYGNQSLPRVAWNGENFLVLFVSQDPTAGYFADQIRAVRVAPTGELLDATPILFPPNQFDPSTIGLQLAGQGGQWLAIRCVYHNDGYGTYLAGQRINAQGQLVDASPVMINDWVYGQTKLLVNNGEYLAVGPDWNNSSTTKARRVGLNGQPIGNSFTLPSSTVESNGAGEYYVVWTRNFVDLVGSRVTSTGTLLTPAGTTLVPNINPYSIPSLAHDGTRWWMEWTDPVGQFTMRIASNGSVIDPSGTSFAGTLSTYRSFRGKPDGGALFAWTDFPISGSDVRLTAVSPTGEALPSVVASTGTKTQRSPDFAQGVDGRKALVFVSETGPEGRVLVQFLLPNGQATSSEPIEVATASSIGRSSIAWNGSMYMITWDTSTGVKARRMNPDGSFVDSQPFDVMPGFSPDVEALGEDFLIACSRFGTYPQNIFAYMRIIDGPTGAFQNNATLIGGNYVNVGPNVKTDGTRWIVTYQSLWSHDSSQSDATYNFVDASGVFTPQLNPLTTSGGAGTPDVAFGNGKYLWVWRNNTLSSANNFIAGRIMNADGSFATGHFTIAEAPGRQLRPVVSFDGTNFIVAWDDQRNQVTFFDARTDIYAARVTTAGTLLDTTPIEVVRGQYGDALAALLSDNGTTYLASSRMVNGIANGATYDSYRIGVSILGQVPRVCDPIDFNNDGSLYDPQDIDAFLSVFSEGPCIPAGATCNDVDFNNDSSLFDPADIDAFLRVFSEGPC